MQQRSEETHAKILQASEQLFAQKGYDATGVADICSAAGVSKGAFYHHFPTKQAVFLALLETWLSQLDRELASTLQNAPDVPGGLIAMAGSTGKIFDGATSRALIFIEFWIQASRQPEIWRAAMQPYQRYLAAFGDIFRRGRLEGSLDPQLDDTTSAQIVIALALGMLLQAFFDPSGADWEKVTERGMRMLMNGLVRREA